MKPFRFAVKDLAVTPFGICRIIAQFYAYHPNVPGIKINMYTGEHIETKTLYWFPEDKCSGVLDHEL